MRDANSIMALNLAACHQIRKRMDDQPFDGALERAGAISEIDTLSEQELPGTVHHIYKKWLTGASRLDALLHAFELDINDSVQFVIAQSPEHDDFVQTIEKLRRELTARCLYAGARQFSCQCGCAITVVLRGNMET